jgi:hypothetical protein
LQSSVGRTGVDRAKGDIGRSLRNIHSTWSKRIRVVKMEVKEVT